MTQSISRVVVLSVLFSFFWTASAWGYGVQQVLRHQYVGFDGLDEVSSVVVSDDGRHVYAAGLGGLVVAQRNPDTGQLGPLQSLDAESEYDLYGIRSLALSPDGRHLYGAGDLNDGVVVLARDANTGLLTWVETLTDRTVSGDLRGARDVLVAPEGDFVYVLASRDSTLNTFGRDATTGRLEFVQGVFLGGSVSLNRPSGLDMPGDGRHLYIVGDGSIGIFDRDPDTGEVTLDSTVFPSALPPLSVVFDVAFDPTGTVAFAIGPALGAPSTEPAGAVARLQRDPATGSLSFVDGWQDAEGHWRIDGETHLRTGVEDGGDVENLYIAGGYFGNAASTLTMLNVAADGTVSFGQVLTDGEDGVEGLAGPWEPALSPDGRHLYVPGQTDEVLGIWQRDGDGVLSAVDAVEDGRGIVRDGLDDPYYLVAPPDGSDVYVLGWDNESLVQYEREPDGSLVADQTIDLRQLAGPDPGEIRHLAASPNGRYVLARTDSGVVLLFERTGAGELIFISIHDLGMFISETVFTADNRFLFVSDDGNDLWGFEVTAGTGQLTLRHHVQQFGDPSFDALAIDPLGRHLYAGGSHGHEVQIQRYDLDATSVEPVFAESVDVAGGIGFRFWELVITEDGRHLLAVSSGSTSTGEPGVVVFARDQVTGDLTEIQRLQDGVDGLERFRRPRELTVSPGGSRVAVNTDGALNFLERDIASGQLSLLEQKVLGAPGEPLDLSGRGASAFSPEGDQLYMPSLAQNSLTVWDADASACVASDTALCLGAGDRFRVEVTWRDFVGETGVGTKVTESVDSGLFWFFAAANWEMLVKVVDGCGFNGHYWVFSAATTNVAYTLTVTDTETGEAAVYENPLGTSAAAVTDTEALAVCP